MVESGGSHGDSRSKLNVVSYPDIAAPEVSLALTVITYVPFTVSSPLTVNVVPSSVRVSEMSGETGA